MDKCDRILKLTEDRSLKDSNKTFERILEEYGDITGDVLLNIFSKNYTDKAIDLKPYIYESINANVFIELLNKYNYNMKMDIIGALLKLSFLKDSSKNSDTIKELLYSPVIDDISFNGNMFKILSSCGEFNFSLVTDMFKNNIQVKKYMDINELRNECHKHAYFLSLIFPYNYAITSICEYYFKDTGYFHSYSYDKDSKLIIDMASNAVMNKESFDKLFVTSEVSNVLNCQLSDEIEIVESKTKQQKYRYELLKLALYKEYLKSIKYNGPLEDAPKSYII